MPCECDITLLGFDDFGVWLVIILLVLPLTFLFFVFLFDFNSDGGRCCGTVVGVWEGGQGEVLWCGEEYTFCF